MFCWFIDNSYSVWIYSAFFAEPSPSTETGEGGFYVNHKKALFCVRLHCTVIPITSSRKVSCVRCVVLPLRPGKSLISPGPRSQGRRCSSAARTRARQGRPQGVGQGSKAPAAEQSAEEVLLTLSTFHSSDNSCLLKILIQSSKYVSKNSNVDGETTWKSYPDADSQETPLLVYMDTFFFHCKV